jgi:hypothetical protein
VTQPNFGRINPSPTIHDPPPPVKPASPQLTAQRIGLIGSVILDLVLAQVALALGNITILGQKPFGFLAEWGRDLQQRALDAYNNAGYAQNSANWANSQLTILTGGSLSSEVDGGVAVNDQFNGGSANTLGASWDRFSDGSGGGNFGPNGTGQAVWKKSGGLARLHINVFTTPLATSYQAVFCIMAQPPQAPYLGSDAYIYLVARCNDDASDFVYARIGNNDVAVGKRAGGTFSAPWQSVVTTTNPGDQWTFLAGTDTNTRQFIVKQNGVARISFTDTSSSAMSEDHLYVGLGAQAGDRGFFIIPFVDQTTPGEVDLWSAADRLPTSI